MKLLENILLAFCVTSLAIGIHQLYYYDVQEVYWILSLSVLLFLLYTYIRSKNAEKEKAQKGENSKEESRATMTFKKEYRDKESSNYTPPKKKRRKK